MSEDIHKWSDGRYVLMFDEHTFFVFDKEKDKEMTALQTTKRLNKQQDTIFKLQDICGKSDGENMELRIENKKLQKENEQLRTQLAICQQSNDDGRFQVWEVPPITKGKRISFTTNNDGDGV